MGDIYAWSLSQAALIQAHRWDAVDIDAVAEEIEDVGKKEKRGLTNQLKNRLLHLLKWQYQPALQGASWRQSLLDSVDEISDVLEDSPSLRPQMQAITEDAYVKARRKAVSETGLPQGVFPATCPYSEDQILDMDFFPICRSLGGGAK